VEGQNITWMFREIWVPIREDERVWIVYWEARESVLYVAPNANGIVDHEKESSETHYLCWVIESNCAPFFNLDLDIMVEVEFRMGGLM